MAMTPTYDAYDAVVAGSGIGGMLTAALLSAAGRRVLVAEAQGAPGGYVHSFTPRPLTLDPAAHLVVDPPMFSRLLEHLGVRDEVTFLDPGDFFSVSLPGLQMHAPLGLEPFIESFEAALPEQAEQIRAFWEAAAQIHRDAHELPSRAGLGSLDDINGALPDADALPQVHDRAGHGRAAPGPARPGACAGPCRSTSASRRPSSRSSPSARWSSATSSEPRGLHRGRVQS